MSGFSANIINLITDNLRDRYQSGFPVLKELLQNADDAGAKCAVFGKHPGFSNSTHPLLQGPGLYFYNDGEFKESDEKAIACFAENTKAAEEGTIGKFGLGMKSVFHLCEAFFYVAKSDGRYFNNILNPWYSTFSSDCNLHPDWDNVSDLHWRDLQTLAHEISLEKEAWFFLWIPLRRRNHLKTDLGNSTGSIIDRYPGDSEDEAGDLTFLCGESLMTDIAEILPLLSNLSHVEHRSLTSNGFNFMMDLPSDRRQTTEVAESTFSGRLSVGDRFHLKYQIHKKTDFSTHVFQQLKSDDKWPKTFARDRYGYLKPTPDKSKPEGSILLSHSDESLGHLSIKWALFLPLDDETHIFNTAIPKGTRNYRFILHGQFFVEAGRRTIHSYRSLNESDEIHWDNLDEDRLRKCWNQQLAQKVVLPLFLPAIEDYVKSNNFTDEETLLLTDAIINAKAGGNGAFDGRKFIDSFRSSVTSNHSWLRIINIDAPTWTLVLNEKEIRLLPIPNPPKTEPNRPWLVFPRLDSMNKKVFLVDETAPRISRSLDQWREDELIPILTSVPADAFSKAGLLEYLENFLSLALTTQPGYKEKTQKILISVVRNGMRNNSLDILRHNRHRLSRIVNFIEPQKRLALGPYAHTGATAIPEEIFHILWQCETDVLLLPTDLDSADHPGKATLSVKDICVLLPVVLEELNKPDAIHVDSYHTVVGQLLKLLNEEDRLYFIQNFQDLKIFLVSDMRSSSKKLVPYKTINRAKERNNLFGFGGVGLTHRNVANPETFISRLASVIPDDEILVIDADTHKMCFPDGAVLPSVSDQKAILKSLGVSCKTLGSKKARHTFIQEVNNPGDDPIAIRGLRYVLHANPNHFTDNESPLWVARHHQSMAWEKLWRQLTCIEGEGAWNVLGRGLAENLPQARWEPLGIKEIEPLQVINEMRRVGLGAIKGNKFSEEECVEILNYVDDKDLWKALPLHITNHDERASIDDHTYLYLDSGYSLPEELLIGIRLIKPIATSLREKQKQWILQLNAAAIINIALDSQYPGAHWRLIVEALCEVSDNEIALLPNLRSIDWLPININNNKYIRPCHVIDIPGLENKIQLLTAKINYEYASVADLASDLVNHRALEILRAHAFAINDDALLRLGELMSIVDEYWVGKVKIAGNDQFKKIIPALSRLKGLPAWEIIRELIPIYETPKCFTTILPHIQNSISIDILVRVLLDLANDSEAQMEGAEQAFLCYLQLFCTYRESVDRLTDIKLLSRDNKWKFSNELCCGAPDVEDNFLLAEEQAAIIDKIIYDAGHYNISAEPVSDLNYELEPQILQNYFNNWDDFVQRELIGVLLCLLGHQFDRIADDYLHPRTCDWVFDQIDWRSAAEVNDSGQRNWVFGYPPKKIRDKLRIKVKIIDEKIVTVLSLMGETLPVSLKEDFDTLIAGALEKQTDFLYVLPIRRISLDLYSSEKLTLLIKNTVELLTRKSYFQPNAGLEGLWELLETRDQLAVSTACNMILNYVPFYLRQLNAHHKSKKLGVALNNYHQAVENVEECRSSQRVASRHRLNELEDMQRRAKEVVSNVFRNDETVQNAVLEALRQKIKEFQYDMQSIPFELYQNADDALIELIDTNDENQQVPTFHGKFVIEMNLSIIRFMHWGRKINAPGYLLRGSDATQYHRDLEKMLILSSSDKPLNDNVTGKFGLGFKTVFLCCDHPRIISGKMHIEIIGGILPQLWNEWEEAQNILARHTEDRRYGGTLIELPLRNNVSVQEIFPRFEKLASLLCIFGKAIHRIEVIYGEEIREYKWMPTPLLKGVEYGRCILYEGSKLYCKNGLKFSLEKGTVLLCLSARGFLSLPKDVPSVWVTAPTQESESFGFAVSAPFSLDVGRSRLSGDTEFNNNLASDIGRQLGQTLVELKNYLDMHWQNSKSVLSLADDVSLTEIWLTLWQTLSLSVINPNDTFAGTICGSLSRAALEILSSSGIPNGLPNPYGGLVSIDNISYELSHLWQRIDVIEHLRLNNVSIEKCVSADIAKILRNILRIRSIVKLDLVFLITKILCIDHYRPELAERLEGLVRRVWDEFSEEEREDSRAVMFQLKFQNKTSGWSETKNLICKNIGDPEEEQRVGFAPDEAILSEEYTQLGRSFFKRCRLRYVASTETLAQWVIMANTAEKRQAALLYLVKGDLGYKVSRQLRDEGSSPTWLQNIEEALSSFNGISDEIKTEIRRLLVEKFDFLDESTEPSNPLRHPIDTQKALNSIYEWWCQNHSGQIIKYEKKIYPHGQFPSLNSDNLKADTNARKGWLTFFLLGACHTIGRSFPEQHKIFLELCLSKGWMDKFVDTNHERLNEWMNIVKSYLEEESSDPVYFHWMRQFVSIFQIGYWLDEYVDSFMAINRMRGTFSLKQITCPQINPLFQGGGPDAPPLNRALGMGASFIMRELMRKGIIDNPSARQYCYVPKKPVRELIGYMGCHELQNVNDHEIRSKIIYQFVKQYLGEQKCTFVNSFDLPIWIVASNVDLQQQLFARKVLEYSENNEEEYGDE